MSQRLSLKAFGIFVWLAAGTLAARPPTQSPDLILTDGRVFTAVGMQTFAQAVAIRDTRILALGTKESEPDPLGGRFVRDSDGKLTGLTHEYATFRLHRRISELTTDQEALRPTRDFLSSAVRLGITSVQNMSAPIAPDRLVSLYESAPTPIRMRIMHFVLTDEHRRGTLESGKFADLAVLSQDIFKVPLPELPKTESLLTLVGGKIVYSFSPFAQK